MIVVKPAGSPWGRCEVNRVTKLEDAALEKVLANKVADGESHIAYPYAVYEEVPRKIELPNGETATVQVKRLIQKSAITCKVDAAEIQDAISAKPGILVAADADTAVADAVVVEVKPEPLPSDDGTVIVSDQPLPAVAVMIDDPVVK